MVAAEIPAGRPDAETAFRVSKTRRAMDDLHGVQRNALYRVSGLGLSCKGAAPEAR